MNFHHKPHCHCPNKPHCGCSKPGNEVVHPVKENVVHKCTEETVKHVHPSHTTVMNHHLVKNEHVYPHATSFENTSNEVDINGNAVGGAMSPNMGSCHQSHHMGGYKGHHNHHGAGPQQCNRRPRRWF